MKPLFRLAGLFCISGIICASTNNSFSQSSSTSQNLTQYALPMCGTAKGANLFPGAVVPFGMIQWSPDTELGMRKGGYAWPDKRISDFSVDHISGAGCSYGGDFGMMPVLGEQPAPPPQKNPPPFPVFFFTHTKTTHPPTH